MSEATLRYYSGKGPSPFREASARGQWRRLQEAWVAHFQDLSLEHVSLSARRRAKVHKADTQHWVRQVRAVPGLEARGNRLEVHAELQGPVSPGPVNAAVGCVQSYLDWAKGKPDTQVEVGLCFRWEATLVWEGEVAPEPSGGWVWLGSSNGTEQHFVTPLPPDSPALREVHTTLGKALGMRLGPSKWGVQGAKWQRVKLPPR